MGGVVAVADEDLRAAAVPVAAHGGYARRVRLVSRARGVALCSVAQPISIRLRQNNTEAV